MARDIGLDLLQHGDGGTDLTRRAIAALEAVVFHKGGLHRVEVARLAEAFNSLDAVSVMHDGQRQTGIHAASVDHDGAGAALPVIAALLGAGQVEMLAQEVEKARPVVDIELVKLVIDRQGKRAAVAHRMSWSLHRRPAGGLVAVVVTGDLSGRWLETGKPEEDAGRLKTDRVAGHQRLPVLHCR